MKILITGGCGFVGSNLAIYLKNKKFKVHSLDNLFRNGSKQNLLRLKNEGISNFKIDIRLNSKIKKLPKFDLIIDACAEPSVNTYLNDIDRLFSTNFIGTLNILKKCVADNSKLIFLSTSRVYSLKYLNSLIKRKNLKKKIKPKKIFTDMKSPTIGAKSLYGFSKFASEELIKEFSYIKDLNYLINRFGVIAGPWQFGKVDQGFFSLWIWRHLTKQKLSYNGFGGNGFQIRDVIHIEDVCRLIYLQIKKINKIYNKSFIAGGGIRNALSLKDLTVISQKLTKNKIKISKNPNTSYYDVPYFVSSNKEIKKFYNWEPKKNIEEIANDIYSWQLNSFNIIKKYFN